LKPGETLASVIGDPAPYHSLEATVDPAEPEETEVTETIEDDALDPILADVPDSVPDPPLGDAGQPSAAA